MASSLQDIADVADELTDPHPHLEKIYTTTTTRHRRLTHLHKTTQPGLLTQLRDAVLPAATQDANNQAALLDELRRWRTWCAVMTGWQSPLYQPHAPCPHCDQRGTLRVNLARQSAFCTTKTWSPERGEHVWCATWNPATIGVLADHVRATTVERAA